MDPLADHPLQIDKSPYAYAWNNSVLFVDPDGRCPECEENVKDPQEGTSYTSTGGGNYTYSGGQWTRYDGQLSEVTVRAGSGDHPSLSDINSQNLTSMSGWQKIEGIAQVSAIIGFMTQSLELSLEMGANQEFKYGKTINGKFRSNEVVSRIHRITSNKYAKYIGFAGRITGVYGLANSSIKLIEDPSNPANWVKFGGNAAIFLIKTNPYTLVASVGFTVLDESGYIDDWLGN